MSGFDEYEQYDALGLAALVRAQQVSALEVLEAAIARIEARNPVLNAIVYRADDAARAVIQAGLPEGPFTGVPYLLKDLYVLHEGMPTTNGSRAFGNAVADHDSTMTSRLRAGGFVIMGKTNTPELGLNASTEPVLHGSTRNPWNIERSAGGSSGGAAAAVAARMLPAAHATDGGGSIRIPAANCALVGLKPTRARNPMGPDVGEGWSGLSTGHAVTRSVRDSAALLDAVQGPAPGDPYWAPPPERPFLEEVDADPGRLRIALWTEGLAGEAIDAECVRGAEAAAKLCEGLGHRVEMTRPPVDITALRRAMRAIISANVANALDIPGRARYEPVTAAEVETVTWQFAEEGHRLSAQAYANAILTIHILGRKLGAFFEEFDVLLSPTLADPPLPLGTLDMMSDDLDAYYERLMDSLPFTPLYNVTGCPAMTLPLHWTEGDLPVGVQFGSRFGAEATLFRLGGQIERIRPWFDRGPALSQIG